jgi:S-adenosylmethionine decarboxylase
MRHLLLDLYCCNAACLTDERLLQHVLSDLPERLGMQRTSPVFLEHIAQVSDPRDAGHSGLVITGTGHCSLHAWPEYGMVNLDLFSCEPFDQDEALRFVQATFQPGDVERHLIERALRSPRLPSRFANQSDERRPAFPHALTGYRIRLAGSLLPPFL